MDYPKCGKCGGSLGKSFVAFATKTCPKCAGLPDQGEWESKMILPGCYAPYTPIDPYVDAGPWWMHKIEYVSLPKVSNVHQGGMPLTPGEKIEWLGEDTQESDMALEAIGRAFDDAIDLAYLG